MRTFLGPRLLCGALLIPFASAAHAQGTPQSKPSRPAASRAIAGQRPNIIYIMADDLGWKELGCYGQKRIRTPNIDRLASQGMRFTQHYSGAPVCAPARCVLMTGMHAGHAFIRDNHEIGTWKSYDGQLPIPDGSVTIASMLKGAGYVTGAFGKWGLGGVGSSGDPLARGFDRFFGYNCQRHAHNYYPRYLIDDSGKRMLEGNTRGRTGKQYAPQLIADEMLAFIRKNHKRPFFVYYPSVIPHLALQAPKEAVAEYAGKWSDPPYNGKSYLPNETPRACYAAMITFLDRQVGRLLALLDELGLAKNTVVMFTSDNGTTYLKGQVDYEFFDSVGELRGLKGSVFEGGIRVPMIARWPGRIAPGTSSDLISAHYDALPTIADLVGIRAPKTDGISLMPTLLGKADEQRRHDHLFWDFGGYGGQLAVRAGRWKAVRRGLRKHPDAKLQLFDLQEDPGEKRDVAQQHPKIAERLAQIMVDARAKPVTKRFQFGQYAK